MGENQLFNLEVEKALIGTILNEAEEAPLVFTTVTSEMFYGEATSILYKEMENLYRARGKITTVILKDELKEKGLTEKVNYDLIDVCKSKGIDQDPTALTETITKYYSKRFLIKSFGELEEDIASGSSTDQIIEKSQKSLMYVSQLSTDTGIVSTKEGSVQSRMETLRERANTKPIFTGYGNLDNLLVEGLAIKQISIITGRPSMGKSTVRQSLRTQLCDRGYSVVDVCTEQPKETEEDRTDAALTKIPYAEIIQSASWKKKDPRIKKIVDAAKYRDKYWNFHRIVNRHMTLNQLWNKLAYIKHRYGLDVMFLDLFDRLEDVNVTRDKQNHISKALGTLNIMAAELEIHICLLVQIKRAIENRANRRPMLSDLKDSGAFEEVARLVMSCYRDKYYDESLVDDTCEVTILKQNNGPAGADAQAHFEFQAEVFRIEPRAIAGPQIFEE